MRGFGEQDHLQNIFRRRIGLVDDKDVRIADVLQYLHPHFAVAKSIDHRLAELHSEMLTHVFGKPFGSGARKNLDDSVFVHE